MSDDEPVQIGRREALKRIAAAAAAVPAATLPTIGQTGAGPVGQRPPTDPDLMHPAVRWEKTLAADELRTVAALCDTILPADDHSPSATQVGVPDFIDEWVSAPYPDQKADALTIRGGLVWLNTEANKRFGKDFADLPDAGKTQICDDVCFGPKARPEFRYAARFFSRFRDLAVIGFYTTHEGMNDLQYIGNTPLVRFEGPPPEVLAYLKLTQPSKGVSQ